MEFASKLIVPIQPRRTSGFGGEPRDGIPGSRAEATERQGTAKHRSFCIMIYQKSLRNLDIA
jgi:hypothetical protein